MRPTPTSCPEALTTLRYLRGELADAAARRSLEHVRGCRTCRATLRFGAETLSGMAPPAAGDDGSAALGAPVEYQSTATPSRSSLFGRGRARPGNRVLLLLICGLCAMVVFRSQGSTGSNRPPTAEQRTRDLLAEGTPLCLAPDGEQEGRPRVIIALVPPATGAGRILVLDATGRPILDEPWEAGASGCSLSTSRHSSGSGDFTAARVVIPFPAEERLPLEPGRPYGVAIALPGGHSSAASVFMIASR